MFIGDWDARTGAGLLTCKAYFHSLSGLNLGFYFHPQCSRLVDFAIAAFDMATLDVAMDHGIGTVLVSGITAYSTHLSILRM